jgi:hypothetical protein
MTTTMATTMATALWATKLTMMATTTTMATGDDEDVGDRQIGVIHRINTVGGANGTPC